MFFDYDCVFSNPVVQILMWYSGIEIPSNFKIFGVLMFHPVQSPSFKRGHDWLLERKMNNCALIS